jgi:hypothetical protein
VTLPAPGAREPALHSIAELASGLLSHVDLDPTDIAAAAVLTSAAQSRRRRLRVARALLPVYRALHASWGGMEDNDIQDVSSREQSDEEDETDGEEAEHRHEVTGIPSDKVLTRRLSTALQTRPFSSEEVSPAVEAGSEPCSLEQRLHRLQKQEAEAGQSMEAAAAAVAAARGRFGPFCSRNCCASGGSYWSRD